MCRNTEMTEKALAALLIAAGGFALGACGGSGPKAGATTLTGPTTVTIPQPEIGAQIRCTIEGTSIGAKIPAHGQLDKGGGTATPGGAKTSVNLQLAWREDGSLVATCAP